MHYAQLKEDGTYDRDLPDGNIEFGPRHFQPARTLTDDEKALFRVVPLVKTEPPPCDPARQAVARDGAELVGGQWQTKWTIRDLSADEIAAVAKAKVPRSVTKRQGMAELIERDMVATIQGALDAIPGKAGDLARNDFLNSQEWQRTWPLIEQMRQAFGWTEVYVDELFTSAAQR